MITDADITKLKQVFATKDDLKQFATKDDLKQFATKDDLKQFATKDDLKQLREDIIHDVADMLDNKIGPILNNHESRIDRLEKSVGGFPPISK